MFHLIPVLLLMGCNSSNIPSLEDRELELLYKFPKKKTAWQTAL